MAEICTAAPSVSVVLPAYNAAAQLPAAVASVLTQSLTDLEIIIVDDASEDDTLAVARRLATADSRIRIIAAESNGGPAAARNRGLEVARGRWIALLDADDAFLPQRLSRLLETAEQAGADLIADNLLLEEGGGRAEAMISTGSQPYCRQLSGAGFLLGNLPDRTQPRRSYGFLKPMISRAFLQSQGLRYDETLRFAEDFAFYLDCFTAGARFLLLREPLYRYRIRGDSLTARHSIDDLRRFQALHAQLLGSGRNLDPTFLAALRRHKRAVDQRLQWRLVMQALKQGTWGEALAASLKGWHVFPYVAGQLLGEAWRRAASAAGGARAAET
jgi:succinoglycan biosynthesis protein ExoO/succinoglycan biosynthesis protein ExoU